MYSTSFVVLERNFPNASKWSLWPGRERSWDIANPKLVGPSLLLSSSLDESRRRSILKIEVKQQLVFRYNLMCLARIFVYLFPSSQTAKGRLCNYAKMFAPMLFALADTTLLANRRGYNKVAKVPSLSLVNATCRRKKQQFLRYLQRTFFFSTEVCHE